MRRSVFASVWMLGIVMYLSVWSVEMASAELLPGGTQYHTGSGSPNYTDYTGGGVPTGFTFEGSELTSSITGAFTGKVVTRLYQNAAEEYAFSYQLFNTSTNGKFMTAATIGDDTNPWQGITISNVGADTNGISTGPWTNGSPLAISRDGTSSGEGLRIYFSALNNGVTLNGTTGKSATIWVVTNAKSYTTTDVGILDSGATGAAQAYAPVPEPATLGLLISGGLTVLAYSLHRRRRRG